jgi:hypothetical protein
MQAYASGNATQMGCADGHAILSGIPESMLEPLVDRAVLRRVSALALQFPASVHTVCFECRLGDEDSSQVDVAFALIADAALQPLAQALRVGFVNEPGWARFCQFLETWSSLRAAWACDVPFVCAAFDLDGSQSLPVPCVSVCVDGDFFGRRLGLTQQPGLTPRQLLDVLDGCHGALCGAPMPREALERVESLASFAAASGARIKHASIMLSRPDAPLKLDLALPLARLGLLCKHLACSQAADVTRHLEGLIEPSDEIQVNLIVYPAPALPLEIELFAGEGPGHAGQRQALLNHLVASKICTQAKADVLAELIRNPIREVEQGLTLSVSWYIKLRFWGPQRCDAKVYIGLMPRHRARPNRVLR